MLNNDQHFTVFKVVCGCDERWAGSAWSVYWLLCDVTEQFGRYFWRARLAIFSANFSIKIEAGVQQEEQRVTPPLLHLGESAFDFVPSSAPKIKKKIPSQLCLMRCTSNEHRAKQRISLTQVMKHWRHTPQVPWIVRCMPITTAQLNLCSKYTVNHPSVHQMTNFFKSFFFFF